MSIRWTKYVACIGGKRKLIFFCKRPISKREGDNIKVKLSEMPCKSAKWIYLPYDSDRWTVVAQTIVR
jgi:hypothetical protein